MLFVVSVYATTDDNFCCARWTGPAILVPTLITLSIGIKNGPYSLDYFVPTLASLKVVELADSVKETVEPVMAKINMSLKHIRKQSTKLKYRLQEITSTLSLKGQDYI